MKQDNLIKTVRYVLIGKKNCYSRQDLIENYQRPVKEMVNIPLDLSTTYLLVLVPVELPWCVVVNPS